MTSAPQQTTVLRATVAAEDAIDFPCAPVWVRHYAAHGMTTDYPPEFYQPRPTTEPNPLPLPDPCHTLQEFNRFYHRDLPGAQADMERELRQIAPLENADEWFSERIMLLEEYLRPEPPVISDEPFEPGRMEPQRKGIEI